MDRQAFRNRMQQLKQYREQNPGKTYLDFKKYADGGETGEKDWYNSLTKEQKNRIVSTSNYISDDQARTLGNTYPATAARELQSGSFAFDAGELPQVDIKPTQMYAVLNTYYPFISKYSKTGHSELITPAGRTISTGGSDKNYNLFCNNCSDATGAALQKAFNKKLNSKLFTTPGDVKDFAEDLGAIYSSPSSKHNQKGAKTQFIPVDIKQARELEFQADSIYRDGMGMPIQSREEFWSKPEKYAEGGEIPPSNKPIIPEEPQPYKGKLYKDRYGRKYTEDQMNEYYDSSTDEIDRFTGKPFIRGLKPVGDIEDAANATPVGDAISAYDTYKALKNKDWGNAGLAALGLVPFVPSFGGVAVRSSKKISKPKSTYIPKVDPNYKQNVIDKALHEQKSYSDMPLSLVEEINDQRNRTYDLMQEPYARERAKAVDHQYGTDYLKVYDSMLEKYVDIDEYFQLPEPKYKKMERPTIGAQVTPSEGNTMYFNRDMIKTPEDIPNSVVLHEMGHLVDGAAGMNNEFLRKLGDKSKFIPYNQAKTMYPNMTRDMYNNILQGTEIKSYMNQFRNYLDQKGKLNRGNYTGSYKNLKKEIIDAPRESFNNIKAIFNLYRSPKLFNKDFQMIPIVNNNDNNTIV